MCTCPPACYTSMCCCIMCCCCWISDGLAPLAQVQAVMHVPVSQQTERSVAGVSESAASKIHLHSAHCGVQQDIAPSLFVIGDRQLVNSTRHCYLTCCCSCVLLEMTGDTQVTVANGFVRASGIWLTVAKLRPQVTTQMLQALFVLGFVLLILLPARSCTFM